MTPERRAALDAAIAWAESVAPQGARVLAIGWSTVELERAEGEFGGTFGDAAPDELLGASCRVARDVIACPLVLLEPSTEGRLARSLAQLDEGPMAAWYQTIAGSTVAPPGATSDGPFGPETLLDGAPLAGPFRFLVVAPPGTITP